MTDSMSERFRAFLSSYGRKAVILLYDFLLVLFAIVISFLLRFEPHQAFEELKYYFPLQIGIVCCCFVFCFILFKTYRTIVRLASIHTAIRFSGAVIVALVLSYTAIDWGFGEARQFPRSIFFLIALVVLPLSLFSKFSFRIYQLLRRRRDQEKGQRTLIYGAGQNTARAIHSLGANNGKYNICGIVDDNPAKHRAEIEGVRVLGSFQEIGTLVKTHNIEVVLLSIPEIETSKFKETSKKALRLGVELKILPTFETAILGRNPDINSLEIRDLNIEDLLKRPPCSVDSSSIKDHLKNKNVLVTGGGGSIGSELVRQLLSHELRTITVSDASELALYKLSEEIALSHPSCADMVKFHLADLAIESNVRSLFDDQRYDIVFHACAYKHVGIVEANQASSILNNILSSQLIFEYSVKRNVGQVVLVSTDKAVNPSNVMGATKRAVELLAKWYATTENNCTTRFNTVRFGNVLGSSGSVLPKFVKQISEGGPLTVTHPNVTRYFMLIPEAVSLILQAAIRETNGSTYVLNMGEPVKINELAEDLIRILDPSGSKKIKIEYTGLKSGEKLHEVLNTKNESLAAVSSDLFLVKDENMPNFGFKGNIDCLIESASNNHPDVREKLFDLIGQYTEPEAPKIDGATKNNLDQTVPGRSKRLMSKIS